jgi:flagellar hook assembly protein FlgD
VEEGPSPSLPRDFALGQNYPNPFSREGVNETFIGLQLPRAAQIQLEVFDVAGRKIRTLVQNRRAAGAYAERWDGKTDAGAPAPSGIYVYRLQAEGFTQSRKLILLR